MRQINIYRGMQELNLSLTLAIGIEKIMTYCTKLMTFKCVSVAMKLKNEKKKRKHLGLTRGWLVVDSGSRLARKMV